MPQKNKKHQNAPNLKNKDSSLFKKLTKIFSGPLVTYRSKIVAKHRGKDVEKYGKRFNSLSDNSYRRESYFYDATRTHMLAIQTRMERYIDFDQMEFDPLLSSALDYYADEITTYSDYSKMLNVDCSNDEIKIILETLFYDVLAVESNLFHWVRAFCKYGDFFMYLDIDQDIGIKSVIALPTVEMERIEGEDETNPNYVQFKWNAGGLVFEYWQIAHFRNLGNDKFNPYGSSVLDGARRIFRQLIMMEDSMMSYRVSRSSEKRVWKVEVGGIEEKDIPGHMQAFMSNIKRHQVIDPDTGRVDLRFNPASIEEDYFLPVIAGQGTTVDTLPAGNNVTAIDDIKYLKARMLAAIKIPEQYLAATEGGTQDQTTLAQKDIHFARTIQRLQQCIVAELEKIARIHLFTLGFRGDDLLNFELKLNNPSKISQMQELESLKTKLDVAGQAKSLGTFSNRWIGQNIFAFSEEELERIERERFYDKRIDAEVEASIKDIGGEPTGEESALGGMGGGGDMALGGDISGMAGDLSTEPESSEMDKPELPKPEDDKAVDKEQPLLVAPAIDDSKGVGQTIIRNSDGTVKHIDLGNGEYVTPGSKGKSYKAKYRDGRKSTGVNRKYSSNLSKLPKRSLYGNSLGFLKSPALSESDNSFKLLQEKIKSFKESNPNSIYHELEEEFELLESINCNGDE